MSLNKLNRYAIILCGGSGTRLWPVSRTARPKQFLCLNGEETLFQQTVSRISTMVYQDNLYVVTHEDHKFEVMGQLIEKHPDIVKNILTEPISKNTLPAIAWASNLIYQKNPNAIIGVFPSDHSINNESAFVEAWLAAEESADKNYLVLMGIKPNLPLTGYGYIKPGMQLDGTSSFAIYEVTTFVEKPDLVNAKNYISDGYLWNSGMFIFKAKAFMDMLEKFQSNIYLQIKKINNDNIRATYNDLPFISMDHGLTEKSDKVAVVSVDMSWSDLGNWDSIFLQLEKDSENNASHGSVISLDTTNSLLWSEGKLIATLGLDNIVAIQTADAILICDKSRSEDIKLLVSKIKTQNSALTEFHQTVYRPWGSYTVLEESANFKIKRITVNPRAKLSMQTHQHRSEHWVVLSGKATISNNGKIYSLEENQSTYISRTHLHRLSNETDLELVMIEVQCGDYVGEDDIVRFDDHYGRIKND